MSMIEYDPKNTYLMTDVCKMFYKVLWFCKICSKLRIVNLFKNRHLKDWKYVKKYFEKYLGTVYTDTLWHFFNDGQHSNNL